MSSSFDPEGRERAVLAGIPDLDSARLLEVGIGDGRMTWAYARRARSVIGVDPDFESLLDLREDAPADLEQVAVACASGLALPFRKHTFDAALLSWSL
jgi:ubiquinone/menaquinone biosynthesis C-methylase UbiE